MTVRILQALSVLALIAAAAISALSLRHAWHGDPYLADTDTLSVIERFKQEGGRSGSDNAAQRSPLVQQAQILAAVLNPPPAPEPKPSPRSVRPDKAVAQAAEIKPPNTAPKFKLHGISYRPSKPKDSMALIWEPDTGHRWVKEGTQLGHITVVEIAGDSVFYTDGTETHTMALDLKQAEVLAADNRKQKHSARRSHEPKPAVAHWSPVRRIRQIPSARAARRGVTASSSGTETP